MKKLTKLNCAIIVALVLLDIVVKFVPALGKPGMFFWLISLVPILIIFAQHLRYLLKQSFKHKTFFTLITLIILITLAATNLTLNRSISGETTQEIQCLISQLKNSADAGFKQPCFLGYPSRQYLIPALPSLFFGRSQFSLNLGGLIYFFLGIVIFASAVFKSGKNKQQQDLMSAIVLTLTLHFYYAVHFLFNQFEQSNYPLSLGFLALGLTWHYFQSKKVQSKHLFLSSLGIVLLWLAASYTPSLALIGLISAWLGLDWLKKTNRASAQKKLDLSLIILICMATIISLFLSLDYRLDLRLLAKNNQPETRLAQDLELIFQQFTLRPKGSPFISKTATVLFWLALIYGLLSQSIINITTVIWIIATILIAAESQGYAFYGLDFRLHRATVILPAIAYLIAQLLKKIVPYSKRKLLITAWLALLASGLIFAQQYFETRPKDRYLTLINWMKFEQNISTSQSSSLCFSPEALKQYISFNDQLQYFYPNLQIKQNCQQANYQLFRKSELKTTNLVSNRLKIIGHFHENDEELVLLQSI